ncbi:heavy metal translocating P-type ATPase [Alkaliphilus peptidifermentans]|uniref:Cd(2+)-exporting ATPase n=1 Tax=Alkaliphilus peptidifermentans DSM 18978 TaxID=1120976 RepID=A0A1G5KMP2_9FIRM|nr:heavy metal translocating P-type ATPase [Alkaliphilus peptidifermentans]SCZ01886.1 Cd2+/Zn2+-exporting ATPase [Alkaliphilus peptidifermentans DSM 18978]
MGNHIKKELILEGLDCANCATKIESQVVLIEGVASAYMNFITKTLSMEIIDKDKLDDILKQTKAIINKLEPHVNVSDKSISKIEKKVLLLMGLSCGNCASKIERELNNISGVKSVVVDFATKKLVIEANSSYELVRIIEEANVIIKRIEPDVKIIDKENTVEGHEKKKVIKEQGNSIELTMLIIGSILFTIALVYKFSFKVEVLLYTISYLLVGGKVLLKAGRNILRGQIFDENFLMGIATFGAFAIGEFPEGVAVMLFYRVGEFFQNLAVNRSRKSIAALMDIRPDYANVKIDDNIKKVSPEEVKVGDIIIVKPGEKIPLDGTVVEGSSMVDASALTGESIPREVEIGNQVLSGSINKNGLIVIEVTKEFGESTVSKILDLVENANSRKAPTENFITKFARYYTPAVVAIAALLAVIPPLFINGATFSQWLYRALVFLVISCPCALVVSIPLGFFGGVGGASRSGVLVKGSNYLEALNNVETVVFDKTGTLTKGVFKVTEIKTIGEVDQSTLLEYAAFAESYSNHPIAISILKAYEKEINRDLIESYEEISGHGIKVEVKGKEILAGNTKLMQKEQITFNESEEVGTIVHIAVNRSYLGYIVISDEVKEDSVRAIKLLKNLGIKKIVMLTGDRKSVGEKVAKQLDLDEVYADLLPHEKVERLELLDNEKTAKGKLVFVGDGINDAPVLARADIGIAMGGLGSDAAIEAADVVIMTDEPSKIYTGIKIAKRTKKIVWQNIIFSLGVKLIFLVLGALGYATMWEAVFADVGVTIIAVLNAMRAMKIE